MEEDLILAKATLVSGGAVRLPKDYRPPFRYSRSTAGPGAGKGSLAFSFHGMRVKKAISDDGEFLYDPDRKVLIREGKVIVDDVEIIPIAFHCPDQAFFNLDQRCIFNCLFCSSPLLKNDATRNVSGESIARMIRESKEPIHSIALTSGIKDSVSESADRMIDCVSYLRNEFPDIPIGIEPYVDDTEQIDGLREAGVTEIKINLETATDELFKVFCPSLDRDNIFRMLAHSVEVFGEGNVSSNIIVGLGETDSDVKGIVERLCSMGVVPTIRGLRINDPVRDALSKEGVTEQPSPGRLIGLANVQKEIMMRYGLGNTFDTMCLRCTCCDLVPFIDL